MKKQAHEGLLDWFYIILGIFTYIYIFALAASYFLHLENIYPLAFTFFDAFDEPYLGAVATYTILKEIRKKRGVKKHRHGASFVFIWNAVLIAAILTAWFSKDYAFNGFLHIILTNSLATLVIWIGAFIHEP